MNPYSSSSPVYDALNAMPFHVRWLRGRFVTIFPPAPRLPESSWRPLDHFYRRAAPYEGYGTSILDYVLTRADQEG